MDTQERPKVFISRCIEHQACRWNAMMIGCPFVRALKPHVDFITLCPEADIGLGIPRDPIRVIREAGELRLYQVATGRDLTETMKAYYEDQIPRLAGLDGFILKEKSPSCGNREVKVYAGKGKDARVEGKDAGFFGAAVTHSCPDVPVENEGRLQNFTLREQFYTAIFTRADFRRVKREGSMKALVDFQARNKLLFMAHNQAAMREMGRLVANPEKRPVAQVLEGYEALLGRMFARLPKRGSHVNVLMHALGYFSAGLKDREKAHFLETLERYRAGKLPLSACTSVLRSWVERFDQPYLKQQTYFSPYPEDLIDISDSGKGMGSARDGSVH